MTHDTILSRGLIALTLTLGLTATAVRADVFQPLPRLSDESTHDARRLEPLPPAAQPLPRRIEMAQSDAGSLQEALRLLESRVDSGAFESAPNAIEDDETPVRAPNPPQAIGEDADIQVSVPSPPVTPAPPVMPTVPTEPVAPEPIEPITTSGATADDSPESLSPPSPMIEAPAEEPSPTSQTDAAAPAAMPEAPADAAAAPTPAASREDAERAPSEAALQTTAEPAVERMTPAPETAAPEAGDGLWQVQLLAGRSLSRVERDRDDLRRFHGDRFSGLTLTISRASPNGLYRLRALDWPSQAEASAWCQRLRAATGLKCMVVRGDESPAPGAAPVDTPPSSATR